jgi:hypothetical protein
MRGEEVTAKIIPFTGVTTLDLDPDVVLENLKGKFEGLVYAGFDKDGKEFFGATYADGGTVLWLLERLKLQLLRTADDTLGASE